MSLKRNMLRLSLLVGLCLAGAGCNEFRLASSWKDRGILVDGKDTEWQDRMMQAGSIYFSVANDDDYLYLCLSTTGKITKAQLMGLFRQSFTVWFDPEGGKRRVFGLRFSNDSPLMNESLVNKIQYIKTPVFEVIADEMINNMDIEVMKNNYPVATLADAKGVDVAAGMSMNGRKLTYELKIPLAVCGEHPFAINAAPGRTIGIGLETSTIDTFFMKEELDDASGYRIVAQPNRGPEIAPVEYVRLWGKVKLATGGAAGKR